MRHSFTTELENKLAHLPGVRPPADLRRRVMREIRRREGCSPWRRFLARCLFPPGVPLRTLAVTLALVLAFVAGLQTQRLLESRQRGQDSMVPDDLVKTTSGNPSLADYWLGRAFLAAGRPEQALAAFRRAALLAPDNPRYMFWQGAAYYALGDLEQERKMYEQAMAKRPDFLPARLNLANNLLQSGHLDRAQQIYEEILRLEPVEKRALYNRALVLHMKGHREQARLAWKRFLHHYRHGDLTSRALEHLHELGDFSFRAYQLGYRRIVLNQELLLGNSAADREREINYLVRGMNRLSLAEINLVVFSSNAPQRARKTAHTLRRALEKRLGNSTHEKIRISWFGQAESLTFAGRTYHLEESVLIFGTPDSNSTKEAKRI